MKLINKKWKLIGIVVFILLIITIIALNKKTTASTKLNGIENFPSSYQPYLKELAKKYPNWSFTALYTNLDWNYVIDQENVFGKNLVPKNYSDSWKNTTPGQYDVEIDGGWVDCSRQAVEYCMDPRNFLNEIRIFQFEGLSYDEKTANLEVIEKILYGTEFYKKQVSYLDSNGNTIYMSENYSNLILKAGQTSKVSPYHLASRIKQEVGPFLTHSSISGTVEGYKGLYNFYNIGATSSSDQMGAIKKGLQYAKDGNGANQATKDKYLIPWNTKERAITGGAIFIGSSYINVGQNTIYLQKFDVNDDRGNDLFWHQYMTNILAPYSESKSIYNGYEKNGILNTAINFIIPVYNNMPEIPTESPNINNNEFKTDNTKVYCSANGNVNIRTGPSTSYEIITTVTNQTKMTRIKKGNQTGERWDKVILENGIIGYIYQAYVTEVPEVQIESINIDIDNKTLSKGERKQLQIIILPEEAKDYKLIYTSSNPEVATIDDTGTIQAIMSGSTIITVKAAENEVKAEIEISVFSKVTGISLDQKEINMQIGDIFRINGNIEPEDANNKNIIYESTNNEIAEIDNNGIIEAKNIGVTEIIAKSEENMQIQAKCQITVIRKMEDSEIHFDSSLTLNSLEVSGIDYNSTVADLKDKIITDLEIEIVNNKDEILEDMQIVGTGSKIIVKEDGKTLREYKIIIYGDVNGDGKINSIDLLILQRHILEIEEIQEIYRKAGNINKNGKKPTSLDLLLIQRHILGLQIIEQ